MAGEDIQTKADATKAKADAAKAKADAAREEYEAAAREEYEAAAKAAAEAAREAAKEGTEYKEWLEYWDKRTGLNYDKEKHGNDYSGGWRKERSHWQKLSGDCYENDSGPTWYNKEPRYVNDSYTERKKFSRFLLEIRGSFFDGYGTQKDQFMFHIYGHERGKFHRCYVESNTEIDCDVYFYFLLSKSSVNDVIQLIEFKAEREGKGKWPHLGVPAINYRISFSAIKDSLPTKTDYNTTVQFYLSDDGGLLFKNRKELVSFKNYLKRFLQSYETKKVWRGPIKSIHDL